jgi:2-amino-4-hydroxy-6-hydroxymethyldihydropteridine diphosphokinase
MSDEITVFLGLGSNMDNPEAQIEAALAAIDRLPTTHLLRRSPIYGSKPWGPVEQADYLNMVAEISTQLEPLALLKRLKRIEKEQGRVLGEKWGPRPIDIDILLYGDRHIEAEGLTVPHPRMWERAFVLRPLADLAPDLERTEGVPINELLNRESIAKQGVWLYHI